MGVDLAPCMGLIHARVRMREEETSAGNNKMTGQCPILGTVRLYGVLFSVCVYVRVRVCVCVCVCACVCWSKCWPVRMM